MSTANENRLRSTYAGITLTGKPHPLSAWFILALRLVMGGMILFAGIGKFTGDGFDAFGYLANRPPASPVSGLYAGMAESALILDAVNFIIPTTQVLIGLALIFGAFVRLAALGGALQMALFYLGVWEGEFLALFDSTLIYVVLFLALGAFAAGRIVGLDRYIEQWRVGEQGLVDRYPKLRYILG